MLSSQQNEWISNIAIFTTKCADWEGKNDAFINELTIVLRSVETKHTNYTLDNR